jgi:PUB domain
MEGDTIINAPDTRTKHESARDTCASVIKSAAPATTPSRTTTERLSAPKVAPSSQEVECEHEDVNDRNHSSSKSDNRCNSNHHDKSNETPPVTPTTIATATIEVTQSPSASGVSTSSKRSQYQRMQDHRQQQLLNAAQVRVNRQNVHSPASPLLLSFWNWWDTQTEQYRHYTLTPVTVTATVACEDEDDPTSLFCNDTSNQMMPHFYPVHHRPWRNNTNTSRATNSAAATAIQLHVTNDLPGGIILVYYNNHANGKCIAKGTIVANGGTWQQNTFLNQSWMFRYCSNVLSDDTDTDNDNLHDLIYNEKTAPVYVHYVPHQITPSIADDVNHFDSLSPTTNQHRFHIVPSLFPATTETTTAATATSSSPIYNCGIHDPVLPYPASHYLTTSRKAAEYALQECQRCQYGHYAILKKYIDNLVQFPQQLHYRCIRISNATFSDLVWNTPARGVLLAFGFVEHSDGYVHFGNTTTTTTSLDPEPLPMETIQELQLLYHMIQRTEQISLHQQRQEQHT